MDGAERSAGPTLLRYTLQRLALFVVTAVALAAVGLRGFPLLAIAVLVSSVVSFFVLRRQREDLGRFVAARDQRRRAARQSLRTQLDEDAGG